MHQHFQLEFQGAALAAYADRTGVPERSDAAVSMRTTPREPSPGVRIDVTGISKQFGQRVVLDKIDLRIAQGDFVAVVGRSGCGKSTLLRLLAGLETADAGQLLFDDEALTQRRDDTRMMFQEPRLLPWKRVVDNVALGVPTTIGKGAARARALQSLAQVGLGDRAGDWPSVLSGGQRQRVALARALVHAPRLLLLDEPLGSLDALTRIDMHRLIASLWQQHGFTALLVTHDVAEAVALADRIVLIDDHRILLDQQVLLPRPRARGPAFDAIEAHVLQQVLGRPEQSSHLNRTEREAASIPDIDMRIGRFPSSRVPLP